MTAEDKARALTKIENGVSVIRIAAEFNVSRMSIYRLKKAANDLPPNIIPQRKRGSGRNRKTTQRTDELMKRDIKKDPFLTAAEIKKNHPGLLDDVSIRTIQHRLQKDLGLPCRRAAKKPLITDRMRKKRLQFCRRYRHWTKEQWRGVMFSDESTFRMIRGSSQLVRRARGSDRYDPKFTVKTVKHPDSVMVWGAFTGKHGRGGLYFLPKGETMRGPRYINVLKDHMKAQYQIHQCTTFMHDGAPCHRSGIVKNWLAGESINVLEWPGNSPDLNPIENAWNVFKNRLKQHKPTSLPAMIELIKREWIEMEKPYFEALADSMPRRMRQVIKVKGNMTKY